MSRRKSQTLSLTSQTAEITALSHDGRGIASINGKVTFIENALPGERVKFTYTSQRNKYDEGRATEILTSAPERVTPKCPHFTICGGCALQHMNEETQLSHKQKLLLEQLKHFGNTQVENILPPLTAANWGYRRKARLGVKFVTKKNALLVGFREKNGRYLADLNGCEVLDPRVGKLIPALKHLIADLKAYQHIAQIEVAVTDNATALIFRHLVPLQADDREKLITFAKNYSIQLYLQAGSPQDLELIWPDNSSELFYELPEYKIKLYFHPTGFTQVNAEINQQMIKRAIELLAPQENDRILDLFCGIGNFTLPLARFCREIVGVEGDKSLVDRARKNADINAINNAYFYQADLTSDFSSLDFMGGSFTKILLDPPRTGALETIKHIVKFQAEKIVYVSCNPATFARDTGLLIQSGYQLNQVGIMDMFPHTHHVETIGVFERNK
jgi:23S rRNA (uracil1939-C5)-methyltransferase